MKEIDLFHVMSADDVISGPKAGLTNLRPTGHMRPARLYCAAREVIFVLKVLAELMK